MTRKNGDLATPATVPHSWLLSEWDGKAASIAPGSTAKGRYLVRVHKSELMAAGALARIGRDLIIFGGPYVKWLSKKAARVGGFEIAPNRAAEHTAES